MWADLARRYEGTPVAADNAARSPGDFQDCQEGYYGVRLYREVQEFRDGERTRLASLHHVLLPA
jgi:hypothetical protein